MHKTAVWYGSYANQHKTTANIYIKQISKTNKW